MLTARTVLLVAVIGPAAALVSLQSAIVISSRVNDARTAQQFGVLIMIPLTALLVAQFTGSLVAVGARRWPSWGGFAGHLGAADDGVGEAVRARSHPDEVEVAGRA